LAQCGFGALRASSRFRSLTSDTRTLNQALRPGSRRTLRSMPRPLFLPAAFLVAGALARAPAAAGGGLRVRRVKAASGGPAVIPCSDAQGLWDPCTPDYGMAHPLKEITKEDIERANLNAFVKEVAANEDKRIEALAKEKSDEMIAGQEELTAKESALNYSLGNFSAIGEEMKAKAAEDLKNLTGRILKDVADKARKMGEREQLARDQKVIHELLYKKYQSARDASLTAKFQADLDGATLEGEQKVLSELGEDANATRADVESVTEEAKASVAAAESSFESAFADEAAAEVAAKRHRDVTQEEIAKMAQLAA